MSRKPIEFNQSQGSIEFHTTPSTVFVDSGSKTINTEKYFELKTEIKGTSGNSNAIDMKHRRVYQYNVKE